MAIYTRFGTRVNFVTAQIMPVWIENGVGEIKWHLAEPGKPKGKVEETPVWFVCAMADDDRQDHGPKGRMVCDGKGICINEFRADNGLGEIMDECERLAPADVEKFERWNKKDGPAAIDLFPRANPEMVVY